MQKTYVIIGNSAAGFAAVNKLRELDKKSRIVDPSDDSRIFSWLICESYDDKGNAIVYEYVAENSENVDLSQINERNRLRTANRYLKRIFIW